MQPESQTGPGGGAWVADVPAHAPRKDIQRSCRRLPVQVDGLASIVSGLTALWRRELYKGEATPAAAQTPLHEPMRLRHCVTLCVPRCVREASADTVLVGEIRCAPNTSMLESDEKTRIPAQMEAGLSWFGKRCVGIGTDGAELWLLHGQHGHTRQARTNGAGGTLLQRERSRCQPARACCILHARSIPVQDWAGAPRLTTGPSRDQTHSWQCGEIGD